jgi:hypothetical protein
MAAPSPTQAVLDRLARPYHPVRVTQALLGVSPRAARRIYGTVLATSPEAEALLDAMPRIVRSLGVATSERPERCHGEIRGPVLWSETMSARSATAGDPGLYVCATATKAYDTDDNRVLKAALDAIWRAGSSADRRARQTGDGTVRRSGPASDRRAGRSDDEVVRRARHNGHRAGHLLEHRTLSAVPVTKVRPLTLRRTRTGSRRSTYAPAVRLLARQREPFAAAHLDAWADEATRAQIALLAAVVAEVEQALGPVSLRASGGALVGGAVGYDHRGGVTVGGVLMTAPDEVRGALERVAPVR